MCIQERCEESDHHPFAAVKTNFPYLAHNGLLTYCLQITHSALLKHPTGVGRGPELPFLYVCNRVYPGHAGKSYMLDQSLSLVRICDLRYGKTEANVKTPIIANEAAHK